MSQFISLSLHKLHFAVFIYCPIENNTSVLSHPSKRVAGIDAFIYFQSVSCILIQELKPSPAGGRAPRRVRTLLISSRSTW